MLGKCCGSSITDSRTLQDLIKKSNLVLKSERFYIRGCHRVFEREPGGQGMLKSNTPHVLWMRLFFYIRKIMLLRKRKQLNLFHIEAILTPFPLFTLPPSWYNPHTLTLTPFPLFTLPPSWYNPHTLTNKKKTGNQKLIQQQQSSLRPQGMSLIYSKPKEKSCGITIITDQDIPRIL